MQIVPQALFPSLIWTTVFDDRASFNARMLTYPTAKATDFTTSEVRMRPEEGRLYVFPGRGRDQSK